MSILLVSTLPVSILPAKILQVNTLRLEDLLATLQISLFLMKCHGGCLKKHFQRRMPEEKQENWPRLQTVNMKGKHLGQSFSQSSNQWSNQLLSQHPSQPFSP